MKLLLGIDISEKRGCAIAAIGEDGRSVGSCWATSSVGDVLSCVRGLANGHEVVIGIDAPRMPVRDDRTWYWNGKTESWRPRKPKEQGWGRHCEVIIKSLGLANPQWTPPASLAKPWMLLGFELFVALAEVGCIHEVFPSASYSQLAKSQEPTLQHSFAGFATGPQDMLDAYIAAATVLEYEQGRGSAVGGGDQLGSIVLPRPTGSTPTALFTWPSGLLSNHALQPTGARSWQHRPGARD
jgi:predicted nuclease with RNAse H fold